MLIGKSSTTLGCTSILQKTKPCRATWWRFSCNRDARQYLGRHLNGNLTQRRVIERRHRMHVVHKFQLHRKVPSNTQVSIKFLLKLLDAAVTLNISSRPWSFWPKLRRTWPTPVPASRALAMARLALRNLDGGVRGIDGRLVFPPCLAHAGEGVGYDIRFGHVPVPVSCSRCGPGRMRLRTCAQHLPRCWMQFSCLRLAAAYKQQHVLDSRTACLTKLRPCRNSSPSSCGWALLRFAARRGL